MLKTINWEATKRKPMTKGELKAQRKEGFIPAVISSRGKESVAVFLKEYDLYKRPSGNFRIELKVKGIKEPFDCFLMNLQYNFSADKIVHADLQELTKGQELDVDVTFDLQGEPEGLKMGGILNTGITSVRIRTLPRNIPEKITVDISGLKLGESVNISDIEFSEDHTLIEPLEGTIAYVSEPKQADEGSEEGAGDMPEPEIISDKSDD